MADRTAPGGAPPEVVARPRGLGVAIVFDWALAVQLVTQAAAVPGGHLGQSGQGAGVVVGRLAAAVALAAAGEALRRGVEPVRLVQIVLATALSIVGALMAVRLVLGDGTRGQVFSALIQVSFAPFIAVRLASSRTASWFASSGEGRPRRLGGRLGVAVLMGWSTVWGVAVAWSQSL